MTPGQMLCEAFAETFEGGGWADPPVWEDFDERQQARWERAALNFTARLSDGKEEEVGGLPSQPCGDASALPAEVLPSEKRVPPGPVNCTHVLRREGKAYPRSCARCRLGPCPFYNNDGSVKP